MIHVYRHYVLRVFLFFFFFNDPATTEIYTLSLHDALPIFVVHDYRRFDPTALLGLIREHGVTTFCAPPTVWRMLDRKSTRLNSSHANISYSVFCLKKKKKKTKLTNKAMRS